MDSAGPKTLLGVVFNASLSLLQGEMGFFFSGVIDESNTLKNCLKHGKAGRLFLLP
jgi:hypothetical protein